MYKLIIASCILAVLYSVLKNKQLSLIPLAVLAEGIASNSTMQTILYFVEPSQKAIAEHLLSVLIYSLTIFALSKLKANRTLLLAYFSFYLFFFAFVFDYHVVKSYILYDIYQPIAIFTQLLIIVGLCKDARTGGKRNAVKPDCFAHIPNSSDFSYNGDIRGYQTRTRR